MFGRGKKNKNESVYDGLRSQALTADVTPTPEHPGVSGAVIDVPAGEGGFVTFVAMADDTSSMYTSTGGGIIGAGGHPAVAAAAHAVLAELDGMLAVFPPATGLALPAPGLVQVTVLTPSGPRQAHLPEAAFWGREPSTVAALIGAVQAFVSAIREAQPPD